MDDKKKLFSKMNDYVYNKMPYNRWVLMKLETKNDWIEFIKGEIIGGNYELEFNTDYTKFRKSNLLTRHLIKQFIK